MGGLERLETNTREGSRLIGVGEAAKILEVSTNTIRRLADSGKLKCIRIQSTNYRKFKELDVVKFKKEFYDEPVIKNDIKKESRPKKSISAKAHPAHYLMHKYWGRKPHNVVSDYISRYTSKGDVVLDPFMGSGVVPIEATKIGRNGIGVDINPMSKFIVENSISSVNLEEFKQLSSSILNSLNDKWEYLYETICPHCNSMASIEIGVWDNGVFSRVRGKCSVDGIFIKDADKEDVKKIKYIKNLKETLDKRNEIRYPTDDVLRYVMRSGKESLDELFTDRALIILSSLRDKIYKVKDFKMRQLLMFTFTSMLANVSSMLPGDLEKATYKSGWVISKFWSPKVHTERNIFHSFNLRLRAIERGKRELSIYDFSNLKTYQSNANELLFLENESVDYIFTDPPYGESIAYLALSQFWNSWLEHEVDYENEIIIDNYREKGYSDYSARMLDVFREMYRVLKNKSYLSFTFHNRDLNVWKGVMDAVNNSGFILKNITLQEQAVSSGTQGINKINTLTGDFVYTLYKDTEVQTNLEPIVPADKARAHLENMIDKLVKKNGGITPSSLYEQLIPIIVHGQIYQDENGKALDIERVLKSKYDYIKVESGRIGEKYQWKLKK